LAWSAPLAPVVGVHKRHSCAVRAAGMLNAAAAIMAALKMHIDGICHDLRQL
jgi:hypothetical protein